MTKRLLFILALFVAVTGCKKSSTDTNTCIANNTGVPTSAEIASLQAYLTSHSITATQDSRGFFYIIVNPGTGANPTIASTVSFKYTGTLENGTVFDQSTTGITYPLAQLILGFQKGLPLIKKGGTIQLFLPPSLGYGCSAVGSIPPGSNLIFNVDLTNVQ